MSRMTAQLRSFVCGIAFLSLPAVNAYAELGDLPTTPTGTVGSSRAMEQAFQAFIVPLLVNSSPATFEAIDFTGLLGRATPTKETDHLLLQASILPSDFASVALSDQVAIALQVRNDRVNAVGVAALDSPRNENGVRSSALNAFAQTYLTNKGRPLALLEVPPGDAALFRFHVVEHVHQLSGDGPVSTDSFGVMASIAVRVYTLPRLPGP